MHRKTKALIAILAIAGSLFLIYDYFTTHYDIPDDYPVVIGTGTLYYVNEINGSDDNSGLDPATPWKTVVKVNSFQFSAGDMVLFRRNCTWRERIIPQSGARDGWLYYGAYGTGEKPCFVGSVTIGESSKWTDQGNNVWVWGSTLDEDAGNLLFNGDSSVGVKKWTQDALENQGDFYFDKATKKLYLKSSGNPGSYYSEIECALGQHMVYKPNDEYPHIGVSHAENIVFENLAFRYGGAYALKFQNVHHIHILNCDIAWMGGAEVDGQPQTRYGNGIEFFGQAFYCRAAGNNINQMYDSGVSFQAINRPAAGIGLTFENNTMTNCAYAGLELWLHDTRCEITDFTFTNNTVAQIGYGWGADAVQRKPNAEWGFGYLLDRTPSPTTGIIITKNVVDSCRTAMFALHETFKGIEDAEIDHNQYYGASDAILFIEFTVEDGAAAPLMQYSMSQYAEYQAYLGKESHSGFNF